MPFQKEGGKDKEGCKELAEAIGWAALFLRNIQYVQQ
jgi:hypothetical protein